jgi:hypothetical protein
MLMKKRKNADEEFSVSFNTSKIVLKSINNKIAIPKINSR